MTDEPEIIINGRRLSPAEASTVRVALNAFEESLEGGLGDDEHGRRMVEGYRMQIDSVRGIIFEARGPWAYLRRLWARLYCSHL